MRNLMQARVFRFTKSGSQVLNASDFANRAASEIGSIPDGASFITRRTRAGVEHLFVTDNAPGQEGVAFNIARTVHAHVEEIDETPDLGEVSHLVRLSWGKSSSFGQSNQQGAEIGTVAEVIGASLRTGEWVAMSLRKPSKHELKAQQLWVRTGHNMTTHQSLAAGARVVSMWAGGDSASAALNVQRLSSALAGFGIHAEPVPVTGARASRHFFQAGAVALAAGLLASFAASKVPALNYLLGGALSFGPALAVLGVLVLVYGFTAAGKVPGYVAPGPWKKLRALLGWGRVPVPGRRAGKAKPPQPQRVDKDSGVILPATEGEYPLAPDAFMVAPHFPMLVVTPHGGSESGSGSTATRTAATVFSDENIGPQVGVSGDVPAYLSWADMWSGTFLVGQPGSGKTALLEWVWGETCAQIRTDHGGTVTPVGIDTKGDGELTRQMVAWGKKYGLQVAEFHVADPHGQFAIDLFPNTGSIAQQAQRIVDAFIYLYGDVSIGAQSKDTLTRVFTAALAVTPSMVVQMPGNGAGGLFVEPDRSPFYYANVLLGNLGDPAGKMLAEQIMAIAAQPGAPEDLVLARQQLMPIFGAEVSVAKRGDLTRAPKNKVSALVGLEHWWSAPNKVSWSTLLGSHHPFVVNTGVAPNGAQPPAKSVSEDMGSLILFSLRNAIEETCAGWQAKGKSVRIFADEVKAVAAMSPEAITWMRSDGRSFGVEPVFATQQPAQLIKEVRQSVMSFGTLIAFQQNDAVTAKEIVTDLCLDGSQWEVQDVVSLPRFHAIVRSTFMQNRQPAFTVQVPNFRENRDGTPGDDQQAGGAGR